SGLNMYEYCGSDPINNSDPLGLTYYGFAEAGAGSTATLGLGLEGGLLDTAAFGLGAVFGAVTSILGSIFGSLFGGGNHVSAAKINTQNDYTAVAAGWQAGRKAWLASISQSSSGVKAPPPA